LLKRIWFYFEVFIDPDGDTHLYYELEINENTEKLLPEYNWVWKAPADDAWRQFRYDSITRHVNNLLVPEAKKYNKQISAAVFPRDRIFAG